MKDMHLIDGCNGIRVFVTFRRHKIGHGFTAQGNAGTRMRTHFQEIFRVDRSKLLNVNGNSLPVLKWPRLTTPPWADEKILLRFDRTSQCMTVGARGIATKLSLHNSLRLLD